MTIIVHGITAEDFYNYVYVCSVLQKTVRRMASILNFQKAKKFPPGHGEWFSSSDGSVVLGCIKCKSLYSVNSKYHTINLDGQLIPSWTCVNCGNHVTVQLNGYSEFAY